MIDLMNLPPVLRTGAFVPQENGSIVLITPMFRGDWVTLVDPQKSKDYPEQPPKFSVTMIFNAENPQAPAHVDLRPVVFEGIQQVAKASRLRPQGVLKPGTERVNEDGSFQEGYGPGTYWLVVRNKDKPLVLDHNNHEINPQQFKSGFYGRAIISFYGMHGSIQRGLEQVQLLARGEELARSGGQPNLEGAFGAVPGEDFSSPAAAMGTVPAANAPQGQGAPNEDAMFGWGATPQGAAPQGAAPQGAAPQGTIPPDDIPF